MLRRSASLSLMVVVSCAWGACGKGANEELTRRLNEAGDNAISCKKEVNDLKNQVGGLKRQLAQAMANPTAVQLQDPEVIELVAQIQKETGLGKGDLDPKAASKVVWGGARAMQACYERALKNNAALQYQAGLALVLGITVRPQGSVESVRVAPSVDNGMTDCIKQTVMRWKFPNFQGSPVTIEQKISLTPKT